MSFLEDIWDEIVDFFYYLISFEWLGDVWEFIIGMFENISEFSTIGVVFGIIGVGTIFLAREYMLAPFLVHMGPTEAIFWTGITYVGTFIAGYLLGSHFQNT